VNAISSPVLIRAINSMSDASHIPFCYPFSGRNSNGKREEELTKIWGRGDLPNNWQTSLAPPRRKAKGFGLNHLPD
jgi:hypothetical protein